MAKRGKGYQDKLEKVDCSRLYTFAEALDLLKEMSAAKFDETVEMAFKLGIDPRQSDQNVRGALSLPKGTGKQVRVAVVVAGEGANDAKEAGADEVGMEDLVSKIKDGWLDFDVLIATPDAMKQVRPLGRVLGPRGLMPNPKTGTVTDNVADAVREAKAGRVEYRADRGACVHVPIGKLSFVTGDLLDNGHAVIQALLRARPASAKGIYIHSCTVSSTMSPGIRVDTKELVKAG